MDMIEEIKTLGMEIRTIQIIDKKIENHTINSEECYYLADPKADIYTNQEDEYVEECVIELENESDETDIYTYDEVMEEMIRNIDVFYLIYDLPEMKISNNEWDVLYGTLAMYYIKHNFRYNFKEDMIYLNRLALARSLVYEEDSISFDTYVKSLKYIETKYLTIDNIKEIVEILGRQANRDLLPLISNEEGKIESIATGERYLILDSTYNNLTDEEIRKRLKDEEYEGDNYLKLSYIKTKESKKKKCEIVDFKKYVKTRNKR